LRAARALLLVLALLAGAAVAAWKIADSRSFQLFGTIVDRVETDDRVVALTFDDGPVPGASDSILAILAREGVRATFFFTGAELAASPGLGARFVRAGHELGNHSYSHSRMLMKSPGFIRGEIERTDSLIRREGQRGEILFRPPYGKKLVGLPWYLARHGRKTIMWDVEPDSYPEIGASADSVVAWVTQRAQPGSIVILHVMYPSRRESLRAVPGIVRGLKERGYRFATVSELLASEGEGRTN
jgi:chitin deacetylase